MLTNLVLSIKGITNSLLPVVSITVSNTIENNVHVLQSTSCLTNLPIVWATTDLFVGNGYEVFFLKAASATNTFYRCVSIAPWTP